MGLRCTLVLALASGACFAPEPSAGAPCGPGDVCPAGLRCIDGTCTGGTGSGSGTADECDEQPDGTACGSALASECNAPDSCIANACESHHVADGTACYDCAAGAASCASCSAGMCGDASCQPSGAPRAALLTSMLIGNNGDEGNMFDVVAAETITITSFETHASGSITTSYEIWTKPGTYVGFADNASAWTRVGTATFVPAGQGVFTPVPIPVNVTIAAGQRQAFYLTNQASNNRYHDGTQVGAVLATTPELTLYEGAGVNFGSNGFSGTNSPRAWEGRIRYRKGGGTTLATPMAGGTSSDGVMFDVTPMRDVQLAMLAVHLASGTHDVDVYFRRGSFAGAETDPAAWKLLATVSGVVSAGAATPSMLPMPVDVFLERGAVTAFYVTTSASSDVRSQPVTGTTAAINVDLAIGQGAAINGAFGSVVGPVTPNAELGYGVCN